jgi:hypothetical protein
MKYRVTFETDIYDDFIQVSNIANSYKTIGNITTQSEKPDYTGSVNFEAINLVIAPWKSKWLETANKIVVPKEGHGFSPTAFADAAKLYSGKDVIQETFDKVNNEILRQLVAMSSYDDDNEYPLWFTDDNLKAQQEALDNLHKQLQSTPTIPANQIYDPAELTRALDEGYNWAVKNHADNFKAEHEHKWARYNGAMKSFDYCSLDGCKFNKDDDGRIWKS